MPRQPPLNAIRAFEAAARLSSITAAANEISVTPAAVSHHIKALEEQLEVQLFVRSHRAIALTQAGERYFRDIAKHFAGIRLASANLMKQHGRSVINIQVHATFAVRWLIPRLSSFHASNPDIDVKLTTSLQADEVDGATLDGAIRLGTGSWKGLHAEWLVPNELSPVCRPRLLKERAHLKRPEGLARETLLHSLARPDDWAHWIKAAGVAGVDPYGGLKYESSVLAYQAALEGHGVAIGQRALVAADLDAGRLVCPYAFTLDMGAWTYYFVWPVDVEPSPALAAFRSWLASELAPG